MAFDGKVASKMYAKWVSGMGKVAGGDTPNWASLPIANREVWMDVEDVARAELANTPVVVDMTNVLIEALGPYSVALGEWLDDPDRFELWRNTSGDAEWHLEQTKQLAAIALAYGYLSAMATAARTSIAALIERHRAEATS